jgi:hypothetical protein
LTRQLLLERAYLPVVTAVVRHQVPFLRVEGRYVDADAWLGRPLAPRSVDAVFPRRRLGGRPVEARARQASARSVYLALAADVAALETEASRLAGSA